MSNKEDLIKHLKFNTGVLQAPRLEEAFRSVDRADFVPADYLPEAYEDYPLPIGQDQTISQPTVVAFMLEKLSLQPGLKVLDVGAGSGWTTALIASVVGSTGRVVGVERIPVLLQWGRDNLAKYDLPGANIIEPGQLSGSFDRIMVSAAMRDKTQVEHEFKDLLKPEGLMVAAVSSRIMVYQKQEVGLTELSSYSGFAFVPYVE